MKQCPRCKKEVAEHAKICPYCGYYLETGYQPMKRRNGPMAGALYIVMAVIFMFSPAIIGYFFNHTDLFPTSLIRESNEMITLGPLGDIGNMEEYSVHHFYDLDDFNNRVEDVGSMVTNLQNFENALASIVNDSIDAQYKMHVTNLNNIYYYATYTITFTDNHYMVVDLRYDLAETRNTVSVRSFKENVSTFEEIQYHNEEYQIMRDIITLVNGDEEVELVDQVGNQFNELESTFEIRKEVLGYYGVGLHDTKEDDTFRMYVSGPIDNHTLRSEYQTKLDLAKFL